MLRRQMGGVDKNMVNEQAMGCIKELEEEYKYRWAKEVKEQL